jgi:GNAT superfamily N-acetyltransferase
MISQGRAAGREGIRLVVPEDLDVLVDIYIECFPDRVQEIFGGAHRRTFIRDYLRFYLSWDPMSNWVYVRDGAVVGFILVPCRYAPWRAMLTQGQLLRWIRHFMTGGYGFPVNPIKKFFRGGFAFTTDPVIKSLWGQPYVHLLALRTIDRSGRSRGLLGVGRKLLHWAIDKQRKQGYRSWWGVVPATTSRFIPIWERAGFRLTPISNGAYLGVWRGEDDGPRHSECR